MPQTKRKEKIRPQFQLVPRNHRRQGNVIFRCCWRQIIYIDKSLLPPSLSLVPHHDFILSHHIFLTLIICVSSFTHTHTLVPHTHICRVSELSFCVCAYSMPLGKSPGRPWLHGETKAAGPVRRRDSSQQGEARTVQPILCCC